MRGNALMAALFGPAFDLVFTVGVLIHISPEEIHSSMAAIAAGSKRFVLSVEYEADHETEVEYRGQKLALWKRSYGMMYRQRGFKVVDFGDLKKEDGFDDCRYWLMERT